MISKITSIIIILIVAISCTKNEYSGEFPINEFSKQLLPQTDEIYLKSNTGISDTLYLNHESNYFENKIWEGDGGSYNVHYYGDFEHIIKKYSSNNLRLNYHLYIEKSTSGTWNFLITNIESDYTNEVIDFRVATEENHYGWPSFQFLDSITMNETTFYNVYLFEYQNEDYYFQLEKGIIGFEYNDDFWIID